MKALRNKKTLVIFPYNEEHATREYFEVVELDDFGKEIVPAPIVDVVDPIPVPEPSFKTRRRRRTQADIVIEAPVQE